MFPYPAFIGYGRSEVLVMAKQHGQSYHIVIIVVACVATLILYLGAAFGDGMSASLSAPTIKHFDRDRQSSGLRLKQPAAVDSQPLLTGSGPTVAELLLVTGQSCRVSLQNPPLSAIPLLGGAGEDGDWVLLAGLGWNKDNGFGAKGPILIETESGHEPANWYFTVEMLFVPKGRWNVRASLAIDGAELHDAIAAPVPQFNPLHIGIAIAFDHGDKSPLVLNLGYGRMPLEGRVLSVQPGGSQPDQVLAETRIFSACLNIQF
jgi:hypothetical protein